MMNETERISAAELQARTMTALQQHWKEWAERLPVEAKVLWPHGAAYIRESNVNSLVGDAPVAQLVATLNMLEREGVYVPWDLVVFENVSGTELALRPRFQALIERATTGEFSVIGAYLSHRLFRNAEEAAKVTRQLTMHGVRLLWNDKPHLDERDPMAFLIESQQRTYDELHSRQTSFQVGRQMEFKTRSGEPLGRLPEVWRITHRSATSKYGRQGKPDAWELVEPLASIVKEGATKYLEGATYQELAEWSLTTACAGTAPGGRVMSWRWWSRMLGNPKLAGYQWATRYEGYKAHKRPGARSASRRRAEDLVACKLPALITLEQHRAIVAQGKARVKWSKKRPRYHTDLLSGVARDARCGHRMAVVRRAEIAGRDEYYMKCIEYGTDRHASSFRASDAGRELDAILANLSFDDPVLLGLVEQRLREPEAVRRPAEPAPKGGNELTQLRTALASLDGDVFPDLRQQIEARLAALVAQIPVIAPAKPVATFRASVRDLTHWAEIWATASDEDKNALVRAAGLRVVIEPTKWSGQGKRPKRPVSRLVSLQAQVPEFGLALAAGNPDLMTSGPLTAVSGRNPSKLRKPVLILPVDLATAIRAARRERARKAA